MHKHHRRAAALRRRKDEAYREALKTVPPNPFVRVVYSAQVDEVAATFSVTDEAVAALAAPKAFVEYLDREVWDRLASKLRGYAIAEVHQNADRSSTIRARILVGTPHASA